MVRASKTLLCVVVAGVARVGAVRHHARLDGSETEEVLLAESLEGAEVNPGAHEYEGSNHPHHPHYSGEGNSYNPNQNGGEYGEGSNYGQHSGEGNSYNPNQNGGEYGGQVSFPQRFGQLRDMFVQTFQSTVLEDQSTSPSVTSVDFEFGEADGEEPSAMEISAKIHQDETPSEHFVLENTFIAEEGKGEALKNAIDAVFEMGLQTVPDDDEQAKIREMVTVTQDGDEVRVAIAVMEGRMEGEGLDGVLGPIHGKKPEFVASLKFGRDLDSLHENMQDNAFVAWHGLHFKLDAEFKGFLDEMIESKLFSFMRSLQGQTVNIDPHFYEPPQWAKGFATLSDKVELRYKHEDELGDLFAEVPTIAFLFDSLAQSARHMPAPVRALLLDFKGVIDGIKKTEIRGLPAGYKITIDYHNFKPAKLIVKMIDAVVFNALDENNDEVLTRAEFDRYHAKHP